MEEKSHEEHLHSSLKLIVKSSFIMLIGILISKLLSLAYRIIIARIPSTENISGSEIYGLFNLAILASGLLTAFFSIGLYEGLLRYIPYYRGRGETGKVQFLFRFVILITLFTSIIGAVLVFIFSDLISLAIFHNPEFSVYLKWFAFFIPLATISGGLLLITRAYEKIGWNSFIANVLQPLSRIIILLILLFFGLKNSAVIFSYNLSFLVVLIASFFVCKYLIKEIFVKPEITKGAKKEVKKEIFSYSWPLIFTGIISFFFFGVDSMMIGIFMDVKSVGVYNAAVPIASLIMTAPTLFIQLFFPLISKEFGRKNISLIKDLSKQVGKWIFLVNLPLLIIMLLFPDTIINILFGKEYLSAAFSLRMLSIGVFFYSVFSVSERLTSMAGKTKAVLFNMLISSLAIVILNYFLIPKFGIYGAAIATMIAYSLWSLISMFQANHYVSIIPLKRKMFAITLSALIPGLILFYVKQFFPLNTITFIIESIFFLLAYLLLILATKCLDKNDLAIVQSVRNKIKV